MGLDVLGDADANGHRPHGDRADGRHLALRGMGVVRVAEAPARTAREGLGLPESDADADRVECDTLETEKVSGCSKTQKGWEIRTTRGVISSRRRYCAL